MISKTTVAISQNIRKKLKKLAGILDISQGEVIERALIMFEKAILLDLNEKKISIKKSLVQDIDINKILEDATQKVWANDPECKKIQEKLQTDSETIDNFIITNWDSGLE